MKPWKCTSCSTERYFHYDHDEKLVLKVCPQCQNAMEVRGDDGSC